MSFDKKRCVVLIPVYAEALSDDEKRCVDVYVKVLKNRDIFFLAPEHLKKEWYQQHYPTIEYKFFPDKFFTGTKSYNHLMLSEAFYERFSDYEYMLIAQTDACIWSNDDRLDYFMDKGYHYYGAPWIPERRIWEWIRVPKESGKGYKIRCCKKAGQGISMGNGGFCLRHIDKSWQLIKEFSWRKIYWFYKRNEDIFFGLFGIYNKAGFVLSDVDTGKEFGREYRLKECVRDGDIPFGVHGWKKDFDSFAEMESYLKEHGVWQ